MFPVLRISAPRTGRIHTDHRWHLSLESCGCLGVEGSSKDQKKVDWGRWPARGQEEGPSLLIIPLSAWRPFLFSPFWESVRFPGTWNIAVNDWEELSSTGGRLRTVRKAAYLGIWGMGIKSGEDIGEAESLRWFVLQNVSPQSIIGSYYLFVKERSITSPSSLRLGSGPQPILSELLVTDFAEDFTKRWTHFDWGSARHWVPR